MLEFKKYLKIGIAAASLCMVSSAAFLSANIDNELSLSLGWRNDEIRTKHHHHGRKVRISNANLWQIGAQAWLGMPDCWCGCGTEWLSNLYVRGYGYYGWYSDGRFHGHHNNGSRSDDNSSSSRNHHRLNNSWAVDYSVGVGYLFPIGCDFSIGPVGGYAYDQQHFKARRHHHHRHSSSSSLSSSSSSSRSSSSSFDDDHRHFSAKTRWDGGWVGVDALYNWCDWNFAFGYEYHFANFHGHSRDGSNANDENSSSSRRRHHHNKRGWGNVAWIDARWNLCDCWDIIGGFKYQDYQSKKHNRWQAYGLTLDLGMRF